MRDIDLGNLTLKIEDNLQKIGWLKSENKPIPYELIERTRLYALEYHRRTGRYYTHDITADK